MDYLLVALVPSLLALVAGGFSGYKWGRHVEAKAAAVKVAALSAGALFKGAIR